MCALTAILEANLAELWKGLAAAVSAVSAAGPPMTKLGAVGKARHRDRWVARFVARGEMKVRLFGAAETALRVA